MVRHFDIFITVVVLYYYFFFLALSKQKKRKEIKLKTILKRNRKHVRRQKELSINFESRIIFVPDTDLHTPIYYKSNKVTQK